MVRSLSPKTSLEALRREAKRLRRSIAMGEPLPALYSKLDVPARASLRQVQQALARSYGFASWPALKEELEARSRGQEERVRLFLEKSVHRYGVDPATQKWGEYERDGRARSELAERLLAADPEIAGKDVHAAVAAGALDSVREFLAKDPDLANRPHPFDGWTPLVRLAYCRLATSERNSDAIAIARLLLEAGADPNVSWPGHQSFTALTGAIGGGEFGQSSHLEAEALATLLIEHGADPLNGQALYNSSLGADDPFWLDFLWGQSERLGTRAKWLQPTSGLIGRPLDYLLGNAAARGHLKRTSWLLDHGADPNAENAYSKLPVAKHAAIAGHRELAELLVERGASPPLLDDFEKFVASAMRGDLAEVRAIAAMHPDYLGAPDGMIAAIHAGRTEIAEALLELGMQPDIGDEANYRALHHAADCGAVEIAKLLIARGAEIDPLETRYGGSPLSHSVYNRQPEMASLLAPLSSNVRGLCFAGATGRLCELLVEDRARANREDRPGEPPLFCFPDDEERAMDLAELLLSFGAEATFRNRAGQTPADAARRRGFEDLAELIEASVPLS